MRVCGIIAEYNPFHNGHLYQARAAREKSGCDYVVSVMAGCFTQRGDCALTDKWSRARAALACGVDAVVELPALFAVRPAEGFARGGVALLGALGVVDDFSFGCETDDLALLSRMADLLDAEPEAMSEHIRAGLARGLSHARARGEALCALLGVSQETASAPNTVLALEYLRANRHLASPMRPLPVLRESGYHDERLGVMASAGAVRASLLRGESVEGAVPVVPEGVLSLPGRLDDMLLYRLRNMSAGELRALPDMPEGLESRVLRMAQNAVTREDLIDRIKCKRYTRARISRALTHALLGMTAQACRETPSPPYARVLGFRRDARELMRAISRRASVPLITDPARLKDDPCFAQEKRATDLWGLTTDHPPYRRAGRDATQSIIIL